MFDVGYFHPHKRLSPNKMPTLAYLFARGIYPLRNAERPLGQFEKSLLTAVASAFFDGMVGRATPCAPPRITRGVILNPFNPGHVLNWIPTIKESSC